MELLDSYTQDYIYKIAYKSMFNECLKEFQTVSDYSGYGENIDFLYGNDKDEVYDLWWLLHNLPITYKFFCDVCKTNCFCITYECQCCNCEKYICYSCQILDCKNELDNGDGNYEYCRFCRFCDSNEKKLLI